MDGMEDDYSTESASLGLEKEATLLVSQQRRLDDQRQRIKELDAQVESLIRKGRLAELDADAANSRAEAAQGKVVELDGQCTSLNQEILDGVSKAELRHIDDLQALSRARDAELADAERGHAHAIEVLHRRHAAEVERLSSLLVDDKDGLATQLSRAEDARAAAEAALHEAEDKIGHEATVHHNRLHEAYHCTLEAKQTVEALTKKLAARDAVLAERQREVDELAAQARELEARVASESSERARAEEATHHVRVEVDAFVRRIADLEDGAGRAATAREEAVAALARVEARAGDLERQVREKEAEVADAMRGAASLHAQLETAETRRGEAEAHAARVEQDAVGRESLLRQGMLELDERRRAEGDAAESRRRRDLDEAESRALAAVEEVESRARAAASEASERRRRDLREADERRTADLRACETELRKQHAEAMAARDDESAARVREAGAKMKDLMETSRRQIDELRASMESKEALLVAGAEKLEETRSHLAAARSELESWQLRARSAEGDLAALREREAAAQGKLEVVDGARAAAEAARHHLGEALARAEGDGKALRAELAASLEASKSAAGTGTQQAMELEAMRKRAELLARELSALQQEAKERAAREDALRGIVESSLREVREVKVGLERESSQKTAAHAKLAAMEERLVLARERAAEAPAIAAPAPHYHNPSPALTLEVDPMPSTAARTPPRRAHSPVHWDSSIIAGHPMHIPASDTRPAMLLGGSPPRTAGQASPMYSSGAYSRYRHPLESPVRLSYFRGPGGVGYHM
mmetsp:Transcript_51227/g.163790  ORF Transcript_51227/g.163790 Transcript_51227/m.163790 type:complete len:771 (-) Transcript_51227:33-2345(-)